jgi:voltage-gated potassium channel
MLLHLKSLIEDTDTGAGRRFDLFTQIVIVISLLLFTIETLPELRDYEAFFGLAEYLIVTFFTIEYILRVLVTEHKIAYVLSFYGIIDLASVLPFYLTLGIIDLRFVRVFRLFRLLRIFKFTRYSRAWLRLKRAFLDVKTELILYTVLTLLLIYLASVGIYYFENEAQPDKFGSIIDSMWWAIATLTTVGYGDVFPITTGGRLFTFFILLVGLGFVSVPSALLASALSKEAEPTNEPD